jgi:hypothetical protein
MSAALQSVLILLVGTFLVGLLFAFITRWRIWVAAVVTSVVALIMGAIFDPIHIDLGNALAAFLPALGGAALGSNLRRKRAT